MPSLPTDRTFIEATEAITWIALGKCVNAVRVLQDIVRASEEQSRWDGWHLEDLEAFLAYIVEGNTYDGSKHGPINEWVPRVERLKLKWNKDEYALLCEIRPHRAKIIDERARIDAAERELLEAARARKLEIIGTPVPHGEKPTGATDPEPIPVTYLLKPVAVSLSYNRLKFDSDAEIGVRSDWKKDYADLRVRISDVNRLWPRASNESKIMFLTLAEQIGSDPTHARTIDTNLKQLLRDAVLGEIAPGCLGCNLHAYLCRLDPNEYPSAALQPAKVRDSGTVEYVLDELPTFEAITAIGIVYGLADRGHMAALRALDLAESDARQRTAEADLPPRNSSARLFVESLAITVGEARRFCQRHSFPVPVLIRESRISWSETVRIDAITVTELPYLPVKDLARRWAQELGESGLGEQTIWRTTWRAFWRGELAQEEGLLVPNDSRKTEVDLERFTRAKLLSAIITLSTLPFSLEQTPEVGSDGCLTEATNKDYETVADRWDDVVEAMELGGWRGLYVDPAMIERGPFQAWCKNTQRMLPAFWFAPSVQPLHHGDGAVAANVPATLPAAELLASPSDLSQPSLPSPATLASGADRSPGAFSRDRLREWYRKRVAELGQSGKLPSREQDWCAAKEAFGNGVSREFIRLLRRELAPPEWQRGGRPMTRDRKPGGY